MYSLTNSASSYSVEDYEDGSVYDAPMELRERIYLARTKAGLTQDELAAAVGKTRGAVSQWESGEVRPRHSTLLAIANATNRTISWLESGIGEKQTGLKVVGEVAAGIWREGSVEYVPFGVPVAPHPDYPVEAQRLYQVRGNSVNKSVADGEYVHCVSVESGAIIPENGDLVVVTRTKHGTTEYTAKRYVVEGGRKILRPESTDSAHQEDIEINGDDDTVIQIVDVVVAKWKPFRRAKS